MRDNDLRVNRVINHTSDQVQNCTTRKLTIQFGAQPTTKKRIKHRVISSYTRMNIVYSVTTVPDNFTEKTQLNLKTSRTQQYFV